MLKTDAHMAGVRQTLLDEQAGIKASEDARKLRQQKKFGKQVQVERLKERQKEKKAIGDRLDSLKKSECLDWADPRDRNLLNVAFVVRAHVLVSISSCRTKER